MCVCIVSFAHIQSDLQMILSITMQNIDTAPTYSWQITFSMLHFTEKAFFSAFYQHSLPSFSAFFFFQTRENLFLILFIFESSLPYSHKT